MRSIGEIVKELAEATSTDTTLVADFQLDIKVFNNGQVQIRSPQNPSMQPAANTAPVEVQKADEAVPEQNEPSYMRHVKSERFGRKVNVDGVQYKSMQDAARSLSMHPYQVKDRCASSQWPTWYLES